MRKASLFILACGMAAGFYTPASAQLNIDCGNPQNALTYYCNNRDQFQAGAPVVAPAPAYPVMAAPSAPMTTGSVMVVPDEPVTTGSIMVAPPRPPMNIDCGNPQNAITYYCTNRDQFR